MGYDLTGKGVEFRASIGGWRPLLDLARENGWEPAGTEMDDYEDRIYGIKLTPAQLAEQKANWSGSYFINGYQIVTDEDAHAIARALKKVDLFLRSDRSFIAEFILFCEAGEFRIS